MSSNSILLRCLQHSAFRISMDTRHRFIGTSVSTSQPPSTTSTDCSLSATSSERTSDAFSPSARNSSPYTAIGPNVNLVERNTASSPAARASERYDLTHPDRIPQRELDGILWKSIHGAGAHPPPPGPNATRESGDR